jgi:hypothetical protein
MAQAEWQRRYQEEGLGGPPASQRCERHDMPGF